MPGPADSGTATGEDLVVAGSRCVWVDSQTGGDLLPLTTGVAEFSHVIVGDFESWPTDRACGLAGHSKTSLNKTARDTVTRCQCLH